MTASQSPAPTPSSFPAEALKVQPTAEGWRPVPDQRAVKLEQFQDVVWTGRHFVAVGWDTFLDSADGIIWHRQSSPRRWRPVALAAGPGGVVAVGRIGSKLASWHSADGLTWTVARDAFPGGANDVADVVATPDGWLAVGAELAQICASDCASVRAFAWTSPDGLTWSRSPDQRSLKTAEFSSVTATGNGFVAGGRKGFRGALWTSPDGVKWTRTAGDSFGRASPNGLQPGVHGMAASADVIVAVGMDMTQDVGGRVRAWWSSDGGEWTAAKVERPRDGQMFSVVATASGFLAVGPSGGGRSCRGGIWESADGRSWRCIAQDRSFEGFGPYAAAASDTVEIAVGLTDAGYDGESGEGSPGAVWWRPRP